MGELKSKIPELAAKRGLSDRQFEGLCYAEGLSLDTAKKLLEGDTNVSTRTLSTAAKILNAEIGELITKENGSH